MARNTTLANALLMLKGEINYSLTTGVAVAGDQMLYTMIDNTQKWLSTEYDWPFLELRADVGVNPGDRYITLPTSLNYERPVVPTVAWTSKWLDVFNGIGQSEYNQLSSGDGGIPAQPLDPIQRWRFNTELQAEVWPIPVTVQTLRFTGQRTLTSLKTAGAYDPALTLDLDDMMVIYFVAAKLLARMKQGDAPMKLAEAKERMDKIRANYSERRATFPIGPLDLPIKPKPASMVVIAHG